MSTDEWMDKEDVAYTQCTIIHPQKNEEILPDETILVYPEGIILSEISQTKADKYFMISLTCEI